MTPILSPSTWERVAWAWTRGLPSAIVTFPERERISMGLLKDR